LLREELDKMCDQQHETEAQYAAKEAPFTVKMKEQKRQVETLKAELEAANLTGSKLEQHMQELESTLAKTKSDAAEAKRKLFLREEKAPEKDVLQQHVDRL